MIAKWRKGDNLAQEFEPFASNVSLFERQTGDIATRLRKASY
jgi:hypothetical protein